MANFDKRRRSKPWEVTYPLASHFNVSTSDIILHPKALTFDEAAMFQPSIGSKTFNPYNCICSLGKFKIGTKIAWYFPIVTVYTKTRSLYQANPQMPIIFVDSVKSQTRITTGEEMALFQKTAQIVNMLVYFLKCLSHGSSWVTPIQNGNGVLHYFSAYCYPKPELLVVSSLQLSYSMYAFPALLTFARQKGHPRFYSLVSETEFEPTKALSKYQVLKIFSCWKTDTLLTSELYLLSLLLRNVKVIAPYFLNRQREAMVFMLQATQIITLPL